MKYQTTQTVHYLKKVLLNVSPQQRSFMCVCWAKSVDNEKMSGWEEFFDFFFKNVPKRSCHPVDMVKMLYEVCQPFYFVKMNCLPWYMKQ